MSGGLDSSVVCAALAAAGKRFTALTMYADDPSGDERAYARLVATQTHAALLEHRYAVEQIDLSKSGSTPLPRPEIGRASCWERVRPYVEIAGVAVSLTKTKFLDNRHTH